MKRIFVGQNITNTKRRVMQDRRVIQLQVINNLIR